MQTPRSPFLQRSLEYLQGQYSAATAAAYLIWMRRYIQYHHFRAAADMLPEAWNHIQAYLIHLATAQRVSAQTQNQARAALLVLYQDILGASLEREIVQAKTPRRLSNILTNQEARKIIESMIGMTKLMAQLLYGSGLKVSECVALRIADVDLTARTLRLRNRQTILPACTVAALERRVAIVTACYQSRGLTDASRWYLFPSESLFDPDIIIQEYQHSSKSTLQKAIAQVGRRLHHAGSLDRFVTAQSLRDSFAVALLCQGEHIRTVQEFLGIKDIRQVLKYLQFLKIGTGIRWNVPPNK
jgi:site-specific recombinase XerD